MVIVTALSLEVAVTGTVDGHLIVIATARYVYRNAKSRIDVTKPIRIDNALLAID
jgi:hypothetical protein